MKKFMLGRGAPSAKPKVRKMFRSGITGCAVIPKQTPENNFFDVTTDAHLRDIWIKVYIELIKTKSRTTARMMADETLEDYVEKFSG